MMALEALTLESGLLVNETLGTVSLLVSVVALVVGSAGTTKATARQGYP
jgi:hypothetical protein